MDEENFVPPEWEINFDSLEFKEDIYELLLFIKRSPSCMDNIKDEIDLMIEKYY